MYWVVTNASIAVHEEAEAEELYISPAPRARPFNLSMPFPIKISVRGGWGGAIYVHAIQVYAMCMIRLYAGVRNVHDMHA